MDSSSAHRSCLSTTARGIRHSCSTSIGEDRRLGDLTQRSELTNHPTNRLSYFTMSMMYSPYQGLIAVARLDRNGISRALQNPRQDTCGTVHDCQRAFEPQPHHHRAGRAQAEWPVAFAFEVRTSAVAKLLVAKVRYDLRLHCLRVASMQSACFLPTWPIGSELWLLLWELRTCCRVCTLHGNALAPLGRP